VNCFAQRIRHLRTRQQRTLNEIARVCGFTPSLLSKIESGKTTPPMATLSKIASALGVSLGALLEDSHETRTVLTRAAGHTGTEPATRTDKGYAFRVLAAKRADKVMQPFLFVAERGKVKPGAMAHGGEEFIYVLEGRMRYAVGDDFYTLAPGDSLYFNSEEEHDLEPITPTVKYLAVFTEGFSPKKKIVTRNGQKNERGYSTASSWPG
jgi:transcriptional regulator with XRE-family HTH domain